MFDVLILKGQVVDGTGSAPYPADVGIMGDYIAAIGDLSGAKAKRVIDAAGKLVTPGFIDIHCHSDAVVFRPGKNPWRLQQGFTTEVVGNCGISAAPVNPDTLDQLKKYTSPFYAKMPVPYNWRSFGEYLDAVEENKPVLNTAALVGHGALRVATVGFANRVLTEPEMRQMETLLRESLRQGAFGMSTGLIYPPGTYADEAELTRLAKVLKAENALYTTHMRSESHQLEEAVEEALRLVENTGVSAEISHHKAAGRQNWGKLRHTIAAIEKANRQGHKVEYDVYPYTSGNSERRPLYWYRSRSGAAERTGSVE